MSGQASCAPDPVYFPLQTPTREDNSIEFSPPIFCSGGVDSLGFYTPPSSSSSSIRSRGTSLQQPPTDAFPETPYYLQSSTLHAPCSNLSKLNSNLDSGTDLSATRSGCSTETTPQSFYSDPFQPDSHQSAENNFDLSSSSGAIDLSEMMSSTFDELSSSFHTQSVSSHSSSSTTSLSPQRLLSRQQSHQQYTNPRLCCDTDDDMTRLCATQSMIPLGGHHAVATEHDDDGTDVLPSEVIQFVSESTQRMASEMVKTSSGPMNGSIIIMDDDIDHEAHLASMCIPILQPPSVISSQLSDCLQPPSLSPDPALCDDETDCCVPIDVYGDERNSIHDVNFTGFDEASTIEGTSSTCDVSAESLPPEQATGESGGVAQPYIIRENAFPFSSPDGFGIGPVHPTQTQSVCRKPEKQNQQVRSQQARPMNSTVISLCRGVSCSDFTGVDLPLASLPDSCPTQQKRPRMNLTRSHLTQDLSKSVQYCHPVSGITTNLPLNNQLQIDISEPKQPSVHSIYVDKASKASDIHEHIPSQLQCLFENQSLAIASIANDSCADNTGKNIYSCNVVNNVSGNAIVSQRLPVAHQLNNVMGKTNVASVTPGQVLMSDAVNSGTILLNSLALKQLVASATSSGCKQLSTTLQLPRHVDTTQTTAALSFPTSYPLGTSGVVNTPSAGQLVAPSPNSVIIQANDLPKFASASSNTTATIPFLLQNKAGTAKTQSSVNNSTCSVSSSTISLPLGLLNSLPTLRPGTSIILNLKKSPNTNSVTNNCASNGTADGYSFSSVAVPGQTPMQQFCATASSNGAVPSSNRTLMLIPGSSMAVKNTTKISSQSHVGQLTAPPAHSVHQLSLASAMSTNRPSVVVSTYSLSNNGVISMNNCSTNPTHSTLVPCVDNKSTTVPGHFFILRSLPNPGLPTPVVSSASGIVSNPTAGNVALLVSNPTLPSNATTRPQTESTHVIFVPTGGNQQQGGTGSSAALMGPQSTSLFPMTGINSGVALRLPVSNSAASTSAAATWPTLNGCSNGSTNIHPSSCQVGLNANINGLSYTGELSNAPLGGGGRVITGPLINTNQTAISLPVAALLPPLLPRSQTLVLTPNGLQTVVSSSVRLNGFSQPQSSFSQATLVSPIATTATCSSLLPSCSLSSVTIPNGLSCLPAQIEVPSELTAMSQNQSRLCSVEGMNSFIKSFNNHTVNTNILSAPTTVSNSVRTATIEDTTLTASNTAIFKGIRLSNPQRPSEFIVLPPADNLLTPLQITTPANSHTFSEDAVNCRRVVSHPTADGAKNQVSSGNDNQLVSPIGPCSPESVNMSTQNDSPNGFCLRRRHQCPYCPKSCERKDNLQAHIRTHTGERPYPCRFCSKAFPQKDHLRAHIRTHTGEKPYHCPQCLKAFAQLGNLHRHVKTHRC